MSECAKSEEEKRDSCGQPSRERSKTDIEETSRAPPDPSLKEKGSWILPRDDLRPLLNVLTQESRQALRQSVEHGHRPIQETHQYVQHDDLSQPSEPTSLPEKLGKEK